MNGTKAKRVIWVVCGVWLMALSLACGGAGSDVEGSQWEADMSTLQWGSAGNDLVQDGDSMYITFFASHYSEQLLLHGEANDTTADWEVTSSEGGRTIVHVTTAVESQSFDIEIQGDTMTYSRPSAIGPISATLHRYEQ